MGLLKELGVKDSLLADIGTGLDGGPQFDAASVDGRAPEVHKGQCFHKCAVLLRNHKVEDATNEAELRSKTNAIISELSSQLSESKIPIDSFKHCITQLIKYIQANVFLSETVTSKVIDEIKGKMNQTLVSQGMGEHVSQQGQTGASVSSEKS